MENTKLLINKVVRLQKSKEPISAKGSTEMPILLASGATFVLQANGTLTHDAHGQFESLLLSSSSTETFAYVVSDSDSDGAPGRNALAANGDVLVLGESAVNYADGTAADAAFQHEELISPSEDKAPIGIQTSIGEPMTMLT